MKKNKLIALLLTFSIIFSFNTAFAAAGLPVHDDFENVGNGLMYGHLMAGYERTHWGEKSYVEIENHKLKVHSDGDDTKFVSLTRNLAAPYAGEKITVDFDFEIKGDRHLLTYMGLPSFVDSDGVSSYLCTVVNENNGGTSSGDVPFLNTEWKTDTLYKIRTVINLKKRTMQYFIDSGAGYEQKQLKNGVTEFGYAGKNFKTLVFTFGPEKGMNTDYYIDNVNIYTDDTVIYVSKNGDDSNDGSYEKPFRTLEKANEIAKNKLTWENKNIFIKLKDGDYVLDNTYTLGVFDHDTTIEKTPFYPDNSSEISFNGKYNVVIPELSEFTDNELKNKFLDDIGKNYVSKYNDSALSIGKSTFEKTPDNNLATSVEVTNNSSEMHKISLITSVYDASGKLIKSVIEKNVEIPSGDCKTVTSSVMPEDGNCSVKSFIWGEFEKMQPVMNVIVASSLDVNIVNDDCYDINAEIEGENIRIQGKTNNKNYVTFKVLDSSGNIVYLDQIKATEGTFDYMIKPSNMPVGATSVFVSSDGGAK